MKNIPKKNLLKSIPTIERYIKSILNRFIFINMKTLKNIVLGILFVVILVWLGSHDPSIEMNEKNKRPKSVGIIF